MKEEKRLELTSDEIELMQIFCNDTLSLEPENAVIADSVLRKLSGKKPKPVGIVKEEKTIKKKRGRPAKIHNKEPKEIIPIIEPEPFKVVLSEELKKGFTAGQLPQSVFIPVPDPMSEPEPEPDQYPDPDPPEESNLPVAQEKEQPIILEEKLQAVEEDIPKSSFLRKLLQKLRPGDHS